MKHRANRVLAASIAAAGLVATAGFAGDEQVIHSWGKQIYERHCASCHGESGKGDGPVAASLKKPSPDLTGIAARGEGQFPRLRIVAIIDPGAMIVSRPHQKLRARRLFVGAGRANTRCVAENVAFAEAARRLHRRAP